eukprot:3346548-Amphidinium_carterae.2
MATDSAQDSYNRPKGRAHGYMTSTTMVLYKYFNAHTTFIQFVPVFSLGTSADDQNAVYKDKEDNKETIVKRSGDWEVCLHLKLHEVLSAGFAQVLSGMTGGDSKVNFIDQEGCMGRNFLSALLAFLCLTL